MNKLTRKNGVLLLLLLGPVGLVNAQPDERLISAFYFNTASIFLILGLLTLMALVLWILKQHRKTLLKLRAMIDDVEALRQENHTLQEFNALVMHDLKSPVRTMTSFTNLFLRKYGESLTAEGREYLTFVKDGGKRLVRLLNGIPQNGTLPQEGQTVIDTNEVVEDTLNNLRAEIDEKKAEVVIEEKLPLIVGNYGPVLQLFQNIIGNSLKYVAPGCTPEIRVNVIEEDKHYTFAITDNGIGIAPEKVKEVFVRFVRLHTEDTYEGSGLGLANCRQIVERMGGRIWLESEPGAGTIVLFSVPKQEYFEGRKLVREREVEVTDKREALQQLVKQSRAAIF
ncbi:MAG: ATP-binding protein [Bacteroidota bacterium]